MSFTIEYPVKIIIAWGEAISGNAKIRDWLISNGYPELGLFSFALRNDENARQWLIDNNFPHFMALINGAEGNPNALLWLEKYGLTVFLNMAKAADNDEQALRWLKRLKDPEWAVIAERMCIVKNQIEFDNNDVHRISGD